MEVASPQGWHKNKELVLEFYNLRRKQLQEVVPNDAHKELVRLEKRYKVVIVTQNVDNLHERAGSTHIIHLHGELLKVRSTLDESLVYDWKEDINLGDKCEKGKRKSVEATYRMVWRRSSHDVSCIKRSGRC
jgi:NAD-dependent deacetylase